jgi:hypothetical protein
MPRRICRCVACPSCHVRYVVRSTPYPNAAHIAAYPGAVDLFTLYCSCGESYTFKLSELEKCVVSDSAYERGYGSSVEIVPTRKAG